MSAGSQLQALLDEFGRMVGMGPPVDGNGIWAFSLDGKVVLHVTAADHPDAALVYASLGAVSPGREAELYRRMLQANFGSAGDDGPRLGLDPSGVPFLLQHLPVAHTSFVGFERTLERFGEAALGWVAALEGPGAGPDGTDVSATYTAGALRV